MMMRFVSWNINGGPGGTRDRLSRAWHYLRALEPDVAMVQEAKDVPKWLSAEYAVFDRATGSGWPQAAWNSMILVRRTLTATRLDWHKTDAWLAYLDGYIVVAQVSVPGVSEVVIASVHAPPRYVTPEDQLPGPAKDLEQARLLPPGEWKKQAEVWYSDVAYVALNRNLALAPRRRFIIGGDWNTGRLFDNSEQWNPPIGTAFFIRANRQGWVDCHAFLGKQERRTYFKEGTGEYQLDHLFCDRKTVEALTDCHIEDNQLVRRISDHAPLVAEFDIAAPSQQ